MQVLTREAGKTWLFCTQNPPETLLKVCSKECVQYAALQIHAGAPIYWISFSCSVVFLSKCDYPSVGSMFERGA